MKRRRRIIVFIIAFIVVVTTITILGVKWVKYIDGLNEKENSYDDKVHAALMGTSTFETGMSYMVRGSVANPVTYDIVAYNIFDYDYLDFAILFDDYSSVDCEIHFLNIETGDEEIYRYRMFEEVSEAQYTKMGMGATYFIENGERKVFFRYITSGDEALYGAYIYNFSTEEYEICHKSSNKFDDEFLDMGRRVQSALQLKLGTLYNAENIRENNGLQINGRGSSSQYDGGLVPGYDIWVSPRLLYNKNCKLYEYFPELREIIANTDFEGYEIHFCIQNDMSQEEVFKLFIEDGEEINYENVHMSKWYTKDGCEHEISSYDDFLEYWDEEKALERGLPSRIWGGVENMLRSRMSRANGQTF